MKRLVVILAVAIFGCWSVASSANQESRGPQHRAPRASVHMEIESPVIVADPVIAPDIIVDETPEETPLPYELFEGGSEKENKNDPAYPIYKEGYRLILDEQWEDARAKFADVISKYPKSEYVDDASYWSAYALKNIDRKKAIKAYKDFIAKYPNSTYFDDAVADLSQLSERRHYSVMDPSHSVWMSNIDSDSLMKHEMKVYSSGKGGGTGFGYGMGIAPKLNLDMKKMKRSLEKMRIATPHPFSMHFPGIGRVPRALNIYSGSEDTLDEKTRIKMDALYALGDTKEDSVSYKTLRDVALDPKQPRELRMTAIDALSEFKKFDVLPDFIQIATNEKDDEIQSIAINYISDIGSSKDKNKRVDALIQLYHSLPNDRKDLRETIFYTIADIGNDKAVDFLISVAKTNADPELRSQAIYYLGNVGGDKARAALYDILKEN
ncbi:MAG: HEAT repeat domain-containing protein [Bacteroidota bacterium]